MTSFLTGQDAVRFGSQCGPHAMAWTAVTPCVALQTHIPAGDFRLLLRWHLGQRFVARVDWTLYNALLGDSGYGEYRALSAGLSFFF